MTSGAPGAGPERRQTATVLARTAQGYRSRQVIRVRGSGFVPVEASLQRPILRDGLVLRGELVDALREQPDVRLVLVTGPPGYGKSTLLAQWETEDERPFVWLSVDVAANDPTILVTYITLALQRVIEVDAGVLGALADGSKVATVLLPRLGRMLTRQKKPFVLVIDDAGSLVSPEALEVVTMVARHLNEGSQLAVAARTSPDLPWSQLRAERQLFALDADDLRFTLTETSAVLAAAGVDLPRQEVMSLLERTEGWPAGIYLAAVSLRAVREREALTVFGAPGSVISDYLRDELLARVTPQQQRFLVRTSILTKMSAALCDHVLQTTGSGAMLRELERSNLFVVSLGNDGQWYRYHRLFGEMLSAELAHEDPQVVKRLHSRASRWLEANGDVEEAVRHAQAAQEVVRAGRLVWSQAAPLLASGRAETLRRWLEGFTSEQVLGHANLALTAAWCALESGHAFDHWVDAAERGILDASRPGEARSVASAIGLLHAQRAPDGVRRMHADADVAARLQAPDDPWQAYAQYLIAAAVLMEGAPDEARTMLETTERLAAALMLPAHQAVCLGQLAVLAVQAGDWDEAEANAHAASQLLTNNGIGDSPMVSLVHCVTAVALAKRGRSDETRRVAQRAMRMVAVLNQSPPWLAAETRYLLARAHLLLGDTAAARVLLSEAETQMRRTDDAAWLRDRLDEAWTQVEKFPLATGMGPSALTSAELKVLQLLPTHLSFEQIGKRLAVSRNTVKSQAIAAYRKLGVSSRAEAVERAKSLGMIQV